MLRCFYPGGRTMRRWREQNGLSNLFERTQGIEGAPQKLGSICTTNIGGLFNPYTMLLHLRDEIHQSGCPIHAFLHDLQIQLCSFSKTSF